MTGSEPTKMFIRKLCNCVFFFFFGSGLHVITTVTLKDQSTRDATKTTSPFTLLKIQHAILVHTQGKVKPACPDPEPLFLLLQVNVDDSTKILNAVFFTCNTVDFCTEVLLIILK